MWPEAPSVREGGETIEWIAGFPPDTRQHTQDEEWLKRLISLSLPNLFNSLEYNLPNLGIQWLFSSTMFLRKGQEYADFWNGKSESEDL